MTNRIRQFLTGDAQPLVNAGDHQQIVNSGPVSRTEFNRLVAAVTALAKDFEAITNGQMQEAITNGMAPIKAQVDQMREWVFSAGMQEAQANGRGSGFRAPGANAGRSPLALKADYSQYIPKDDPADMQVNTGHRGRPPLALPADDRSYLAPQGD